jgi:hypothetical protein
MIKMVKKRKDKMNGLNENLGTKGLERMKNNIKILEEIQKNDYEYKILLARKESGESVKDLIKKNRKHGEILAKKNKEKTIEFKKWQKSEDGKKWLKLFEEKARTNRNLDSDIRYIIGADIADELKKNEEEYEKLLERRNEGEYVDDLIKQNLYTARILMEQHEKVWDKAEAQKKIQPDDKIEMIEEEYKNLLETRKKGKYSDDLIKQNLYTARVLIEQYVKGRDEVEAQKRIQTALQVHEWVVEAQINIKSFLNFHTQYEKLLKLEKIGEDVEYLIRKNRTYAETVRKNYMKVLFNAQEWYKMNPDWFQDSKGKHHFLKTFHLSYNKNRNQIGKENKKKNSLKCPNCKILMEYLIYLDAYQCPKCRKKFYLWENEFFIFGHI